MSHNRPDLDSCNNSFLPYIEDTGLHRASALPLVSFGSRHQMENVPLVQQAWSLYQVYAATSEVSYAEKKETSEQDNH